SRTLLNLTVRRLPPAPTLFPYTTLFRSQVQLENEENIHLEQAPFVIVSNHASLYDIPVLFASLPLNFRMAAKRELFSTPIWGRRSEEHTSELQSRENLVCRLLLEKKNKR